MVGNDFNDVAVVVMSRGDVLTIGDNVDDVVVMTC
jgi:hypothetical protein